MLAALALPISFRATGRAPVSNHLRSLSRWCSMTSTASSAAEQQPEQQPAGLADWPAAFDNSLIRQLRAEPDDAPPHVSRQVFGAHYTRVRPTVTNNQPILVVWSASVAESLGLSAADCESDAFLTTFAGSPPESYECWATAYGASFTGQYGGQRGDGRAISIGQCAGLEVQLKGAGTTPYSRQFDGRAVLRSSVREVRDRAHVVSFSPLGPHARLLRVYSFWRRRQWVRCACPPRARCASFRPES